MNHSTIKRSAIRAALITALVMGYWLWQDTPPQANHHAQLVGDDVDPPSFPNPYAQVPAQCYIETAAGTQNACLFCHTSGIWRAGMGNNNPQAGAIEDIGNFQLQYSFAPYSDTAPLASINRWRNTLFPELLADDVRKLGIYMEQWDMQRYIRDNNWRTAYQQRPSKDTRWDTGDLNSPFRLLPALNPDDLPAHNDGFVRAQDKHNAFFHDGQGYNTGWRAINFMPYGIFTPQTGSVSGIYIRLPEAFMKNQQGQFDLAIYDINLNLLAKAIQNRLEANVSQHYVGMAAHIPLEKGVYPTGTEFAHPLHYVDVDADGTDKHISSFPGTRSQRVKEVRYMRKWEDYNPMSHRASAGADPTRIYGNDHQGWVDNGAGWYLVGFIEDASGALRPQNRQEMMQCIGCHSAARETEFPTFTSGTGNTVDSTWALPRQLPNAGWQEMNYLGYVKQQPTSTLPEPINQARSVGEYRLFLEHVVGANLYGEMPTNIETTLSSLIRKEFGYTQDWPKHDTSTPEAYRSSQQLRQRLMRELTAKAGYKDRHDRILSALLYPPKQQALLGAARYRQVVVTQSYTLGKDVFAQTPHTFKAMRAADQQPTNTAGTPYQFGEVITERAIEQDNPASATYRAGNTLTDIQPTLPFSQGGNYFPEYMPFLQHPSTGTP